MSQLVDLAVAYKVSKEQSLPSGIDNFIYGCVLENKEEMIKSISKLNYQSLYIVETFVLQILKGMFIEKSQKEILDIIAGGSLFKIKDKLFDAFINDEDIKYLMRGK